MLLFTDGSLTTSFRSIYLVQSRRIALALPDHDLATRIRCVLASGCRARCRPAGGVICILGFDVVSHDDVCYERLELVSREEPSRTVCDERH